MKKQLGWQWEFGGVSKTMENGLGHEKQVIFYPSAKSG